MNRIAVAIVHGVEIADPAFAAEPARLLRRSFAAELGLSPLDADNALVIEPVYWAPHIEGRQRELFAKMCGDDAGTFFDDHLEGIVKSVNAGSAASLARLLASLVRRTTPEIRTLHYPTARWLTLHFVGDIIAYDRKLNEENYVAAHHVLAQALAVLADKAGDRAPLCVLAHSFGSVLVSDYLYDQQETLRGRKLVPDAVRAVMGTSPLARGETLAWLYTMGSPLALWSLRNPDAGLDRPIDFPGADIAGRGSRLRSEWVNFYDRDDVIAYPLRPLGPAYARQVTMDRPVTVRGPWPVFATPLVHPFYWTDPQVIDAIGGSLAAGWRNLNPD
ncbi:hypothetical protein OG884_04210 [Streptosporangium sp. NBC_01755]|uniref:hypothetical protein n=1 Tax=unclassified Streptosporangium TaxID=2632669 RepID=UPI002DDAC3CF|nr:MULTISPECIES: hypothetical protein [unclassified Streptosporangium]WSA27298.1 hypothetical protein OIE13_05325 [Streptosporangium sp. NBC_01810]WSD01150.1 hypothetical protein OG884_04210 [Streptosporangium sp. NBC_01755]